MFWAGVLSRGEMRVPYKDKPDKFKRQTKNQLEVSCSFCSRKMFLFPALTRARKHGLFCDKLCLGKYRSEHLVSAKAANYKTGSRQSRGYIEVEARWHPGQNKKGYVALHRLLLEAKLGRFLNDDEVVHHKDHDNKNNHWDNLEAMNQKKHASLHFKQDEKTGRIVSENI